MFLQGKNADPPTPKPLEKYFFISLRKTILEKYFFYFSKEKNADPPTPKSLEKYFFYFSKEKILREMFFLFL